MVIFLEARLQLQPLRNTLIQSGAVTHDCRKYLGGEGVWVMHFCVLFCWQAW